MPRFALVTGIVTATFDEVSRCARSIERQLLADWEWIVVFDSAPPRHVAEVLRELRQRDKRVSYFVVPESGELADLLSAGVAASSGEWVAFVDIQGELEASALARIDEVVDAVFDLDFVYSDELVWDRERQTYERRYKPAWSPERLRCQHYIGSLAVYRRTVLVEVGGPRPGLGAAMGHDLALRISERSREIRHVTAALYRDNAWVDGAGDESRPRVVREHCERVGLAIDDVVPGEVPGTVSIRRRVVGEPLVSVIIPSMGPTAVVRGQERSLLESVVGDLVHRTSYQNLEILIVPDPDSPPDVMDRCRALDPTRVTVLPPVPRPFNYSVKVNVGAAHARGDFLLFLNDDTEVTHPDWLEPMIAIAQQEDVGMVGAYLRFEDTSIQHAGVFLHGGPGHIAFREMPDEFHDPALLVIDRECITITGACMLMPYGVYDDLGGHTLILPSNWDDVDLGLKVVTSGRRVVWTPHARLFHFESMSRDPWVQYFELLRFWGRWAAEVLADPFFTPPIGPSSYAWPAVRFR
jgi:glycosyltransferase involved in cell wall biosynthesis